jgi:hypothetical protein
MHHSEWLVSQSKHGSDWEAIVFTFIFNSERALDGEQGRGNDQSLVISSPQHNTSLRSVVWVSKEKAEIKWSWNAGVRTAW